MTEGGDPLPGMLGTDGHGRKAPLLEGEAPHKRVQRLLSLLELSCDWLWETDDSLRFTAIQRIVPGKLALSDDELIGRRRWEMQGELIWPQSWAEHRATIEARKPFRDLIVRRWGADGQPYYHMASGMPVFDADGRFVGYRGVGTDISEQMRTHEAVERLAMRDALTGLPNWQAFDERAQRMLSNADAEGKMCAMLYIDLDDFGVLNKGHGHRVGDKVLMHVAQRVREVVREPGLVARRGGDELVALLGGVTSREEAEETAGRLIEAISQPVLDLEIAVTASVGVAFFPQDGVDLDALLNAADAAMSHAKQLGRRTHAVFTQAIARREHLRQQLKQRLRQAFEARDLRLYYQPLVSMTSGRMVGAEALLRWKDVERGDIPPTEFIPIAEESELIIGVGDWVLREVCRQIQIWRQIGMNSPPIAINISGKQLQQGLFVDNVLAALNQFRLAPADIEIEVTETGLDTAQLDTSPISRKNIDRLHGAGVKIALDDFGVAYSSLSHLRDLPISRVKLDRTFTVACTRDARSLAIVKAVIDMAHGFKPRMEVTAEGVETVVQQGWMRHLECDSAQGYLFARPMSAEDFITFAGRTESGQEKSLMR